MRTLLAGALMLITLLWQSSSALGLSGSGAQLFDLHCAGCHPNGGNIIRRGRTLKLKALEKEKSHMTERLELQSRDQMGEASNLNKRYEKERELNERLSEELELLK